MSKASRAARNQEQMRKREQGPYIAMPIVVGRSDEFWNLSAQAMRVLNYLWFAQYNGHNNGDLSAAYSQMRAHPFSVMSFTLCAMPGRIMSSRPA